MKVSFIGHRKIDRPREIKEKLAKVAEELIAGGNVSVFYFGSRSEFNDICYEAISELKIKYPHIKRVYVRAEYEYINAEYTEYLLQFYEETFFSQYARGANALSYVKRNQELVDLCDILVTYCKIDYKPNARMKSGAVMAVEYARQKNKYIVNLFV